MSKMLSDQKPAKIFSNRTSRRHSEKQSKTSKMSKLSVFNRNDEWLKNKETKLAEKRRFKNAHETDGCTFEPETHKSKRSYNVSKHSARSNNSSIGGKTNRSYSDIHGGKFSSKNSTERSYAESEQISKYLKSKFKENNENNSTILTQYPTLNLEDSNKIEQE